MFEVSVCVVCVFKQKTAYEMRISDWSSDVCSSDLRTGSVALGLAQALWHYADLGAYSGGICSSCGGLGGVATSGQAAADPGCGHAGGRRGRLPALARTARA